MAALWITYAWADNADSDIDFIIQELGFAGLSVKIDRWNISAGRSLWEQIEHFITNPSRSDGWVFVVTQSSLASQACKEEYAYALDRALKGRGEHYPIIGLFLGSVDESLIPAGIRTRLHVSVTDPDWKERIVAAVEGRTVKTSRTKVDPFHIKAHAGLPGDKPIAIEVRPRAGVWAPFFAAIPLSERKWVDPFIINGPRDVPTNTGILRNSSELADEERGLWVMLAGDAATPTESYYIWCKQLPSSLMFGVNGGAPQFTVSISASDGI